MKKLTWYKGLDFYKQKENKKKKEENLGKREIVGNRLFLLFPQGFQKVISPFPTVFFYLWQNFLPFLSNLRLLSANSFSFKAS